MKPKTLALAVEDPSSHARARLEDRALTSLAIDNIVVRVAEAMASGQWVTGESHRELAKEHSASLDTVMGWAASASRLLRIMQRADVEDLRARNAAHLETLARDAHRDGDFGAAVRAIDTAARLQGLIQPAGGASVAVQVNVSLEQHPEYQQLEQRIVDALEPFPEARIAVARALRSG